MQDEVGMARSQLLDGMITVPHAFGRWSNVQSSNFFWQKVCLVAYNRPIGSTTSIPLLYQVYCILPYFGGSLIQKRPPVLFEPFSKIYRNGRSSVIFIANLGCCFARKKPPALPMKCFRSEPENRKRRWKKMCFGPKPWLVVVDRGFYYLVI